MIVGRCRRLQRGAERPRRAGAQDRLLPESLLVGGADRLDLGVALRLGRVRIKEEDDLAALLDDVAVSFLPLAGSLQDGQPLREARGDFRVDERFPLSRGDRRAVRLSTAEEELGAQLQRGAGPGSDQSASRRRDRICRLGHVRTSKHGCVVRIIALFGTHRGLSSSQHRTYSQP